MDSPALMSKAETPAPMLGRERVARPALVLPRGGSWGERAAQTVRDLGGKAVVVDLIRTRAADSPELRRAQDLLAAGEYTWLVLTSAAAVPGLPSQVQAKIAAVGPATAAALAKAGHHADFTPEHFNARSLAASFHPRGNVLLLRSQLAHRATSSAGLLAALAESADRVDDVIAYRTEAIELSDADKARLRQADCALITSGSVARALAATQVQLPVACIGSASASVSRSLGLNVVAIAERAQIESLIGAAIHWWHHERRKKP